MSSFRRHLPQQRLNNGLLPVRVSEAMLAEIFAAVERDPATAAHRPRQTTEISRTSSKGVPEINQPCKKQCLMNGYDDVLPCCYMRDEIAAFEQARAAAKRVNMAVAARNTDLRALKADGRKKMKPMKNKIAVLR